MKKLTILDGGMGRELKRIGAPFSQPLWSAQALIESPEHVFQAHQRFIESGAEIIIANSYACVPFHLGEELYVSDGPRLAGEAAAIAKSAVQESGKDVLVAGCIPPAFGSYRPDLFKPDEAFDIFTSLFKAQDPFADLWIAETISSLEELAAIQKVLAQTDKPCYYAFTLDDGEGEARLRSGEPVKLASERVCKAGGAGILFNCSVPEAMEKAIKEARSVMVEHGKNIDLGAYANNFTPIKSDHQANDTLQAMRELSPEDYLEFAKRWREAGATVIGGCCGIGPEHIYALVKWRDSLN
ncbi:homocysteine S-methyltransferase [Photobacterium rosenbergii]|uniref:Homocysteine S-methyltransferase n=1 Tax=Photobacterium rosenbergii TaxID=294936 RepID=A0A2T3NF04_9GAMM|nr:homocysteine S-methyltransferase family protein [Photobacterium rosenbergii]PSW13153.1 homocysteine S-methyltransferase [Photobacterium rosenbergii]